MSGGGVLGWGFGVPGPQGGFGGGMMGSPISPVITSGQGGRGGAMAPYVQALEAGWYGALHRMLSEAAALGAEGVVGVRIARAPLQNQTWEFTALGTAVTFTDPTRVPRRAGAAVWSTELSVEDTASAILSGFLPHEIVLGMSVATKHEDWLLRRQQYGWDNQEVEGMSELIHAARSEARTRLADRAARSGGSDLVVTTMSLHEFETPCGGQDGKDFHAEATFVGTTLVPVASPHGASRAPEIMKVLPLRDPTT